MGSDSFHHFGVLHESKLREDGDRLQVDAECPHNTIDDPVPCAWMRDQRQECTGDQHIVDLHAVQFFGVGLLQGDTHGVNDPHCAGQRDEVQEGVYVEFHQEAAVQPSREEDGRQFLRFERQSGAALDSQQFVDEHGRAREVRDFGQDEEHVVVFDHSPEQDQCLDVVRVCRQPSVRHRFRPSSVGLDSFRFPRESIDAPAVLRRPRSPAAARGCGSASIARRSAGKAPSFSVPLDEPRFPRPRRSRPLVFPSLPLDPGFNRWVCWEVERVRKGTKGKPIPPRGPRSSTRQVLSSNETDGRSGNGERKA
eukprot:scaffold932_cov328-Pavlova_lutheri.AAC.12